MKWNRRRGAYHSTAGTIKRHGPGDAPRWSRRPCMSPARRAGWYWYPAEGTPLSGLPFGPFETFRNARRKAEAEKGGKS